MRADFEKGTKVCSKCKRELPIEMFGKDKTQKMVYIVHVKNVEVILLKYHRAED